MAKLTLLDKRASHGVVCRREEGNHVHECLMIASNDNSKLHTIVCECLLANSNQLCVRLGGAQARSVYASRQTREGMAYSALSRETGTMRMLSAYGLNPKHNPKIKFLI